MAKPLPYGRGSVLAACLLFMGAAPPVSPLVEAVKSGDLAAVRALIQRGADVNQADRDGSRALHWATYQDDAGMVGLLIGAKADAKAANRYGAAPLSLACVNGNPKIVEALLNAGADPNTAQHDGETAVMTAARTGNVEVLRLLVSHGADVNAKEEWKNQTALMWAAAANNASAIKFLIEAGANIAARSKVSGPLSGAEPGDKGFTAMLFAARGGHTEAARALLAGGANVNDALADGTSALVLATISARYDMAAFLLDSGANPNAMGQGWTALHQIVWSRRPNRGLNTVGPAARGSVSSMELAKRLIAHGADVNARMTKEASSLYAGRNALDRIGATPFFLAAHRVDLEYMRFLLANGADPSVTNERHTTALMVAAGVGLLAPGENPGVAEEFSEAVKLCLKLGGDATVMDDNGDTALHGAALSGSIGAVEQLVAAGARLDAKNEITRMTRSSGDPGSLGWTPLMIAEGIFTNATIKSQPPVAALLRRLLKERGLPVPAPTAGAVPDPPPVLK